MVGVQWKEPGNYKYVSPVPPAMGKQSSEYTGYSPSRKQRRCSLVWRSISDRLGRALVLDGRQAFHQRSWEAAAVKCVLCVIWAPGSLGHHFLCST